MKHQKRKRKLFHRNNSQRNIKYQEKEKQIEKGKNVERTQKEYLKG